MIAVVATLAAGLWTTVPGAWSPDAELVQKMQDEVQAGFELQAPLVGPKAPQWPNYSFQIRAEIWRDRKTIFVHGVCQRFLEHFDMTRWQVVSDGGPCFFQAKYDAENGKIFDFMFNGPYVPSRPSSKATVAPSVALPSSTPPVQRN